MTAEANVTDLVAESAGVVGSEMATLVAVVTVTESPGVAGSTATDPVAPVTLSAGVTDSECETKRATAFD